jgi:hypothetical protein
LLSQFTVQFTNGKMVEKTSRNEVAERSVVCGGSATGGRLDGGGKNTSHAELVTPPVLR